MAQGVSPVRAESFKLDCRKYQLRCWTRKILEGELLSGKCSRSICIHPLLEIPADVDDVVNVSSATRSLNQCARLLRKHFLQAVAAHGWGGQGDIGVWMEYLELYRILDN